MTGFHSWDEVKEEVCDTEDLDEITAGARRRVAEARAHRLAEMRRQLGLTQREVADRMHVRQERGLQRDPGGRGVAGAPESHASRSTLASRRVSLPYVCSAEHRAEPEPELPAVAGTAWKLPFGWIAANSCDGWGR